VLGIDGGISYSIICYANGGTCFYENSITFGLFTRFSTINFTGKPYLPYISMFCYKMPLGVKEMKKTLKLKKTRGVAFTFLAMKIWKRPLKYLISRIICEKK